MPVTMLDIKPINDSIAFSPQIFPEDIADIAQLGYTQIICNRPDGEAPNQPTIETIQHAATLHHVKVVYAPIDTAHLSSTSLSIVADSLANNEKTLLYCLSGMRSAIVWAICEIKSGKPSAEVIFLAEKSGHNLQSLEPFIQNCAQQIH